MKYRVEHLIMYRMNTKEVKLMKIKEKENMVPLRTMVEFHRYGRAWKIM